MFHHILNYIFLDNPVYNYLIVLVVIVFTLFIKGLLSKYVAGIIARLISRKNKPFNIQRFQNLVLIPIEYFLVILTIVLAIETLQFPSQLSFNIHKTPFAHILENVGNIAIIVSFIWLCVRLIDYVAELLHEKAMLTADKADDQLVIFFKDFFKVLVCIIGLLLIIRFGFNKPVGNVLTGLSIVGAALALAFRESLENLIASFIIFFDKPFSVGDLVKVQTVNGTVEKIGLRSTRIRTTDKTYVTVPNKQMVDSILDNQSLRTQRKVDTKLLLNISTSVDQINELLKKLGLILNKEDIEDALFYVSDTGQHAHIITIEYFTPVHQSIESFLQLRQAVNIEIIAATALLKIEIADPYKTVLAS